MSGIMKYKIASSTTNKIKLKKNLLKKSIVYSSPLNALSRTLDISADNSSPPLTCNIHPLAGLPHIVPEPLCGEWERIDLNSDLLGVDNLARYLGQDQAVDWRELSSPTHFGWLVAKQFCWVAIFLNS